MLLSEKSLLSLQSIKHFLIGFVFILNFLLYKFTKLVKKNKNCLKKNNCSLSYSSRRIQIIKNTVFFMNCYILINLVIPFNKYITKIPIISGFYSLICLVIIITLILFLKQSLSILNKEDCLKCLGLGFSADKNGLLNIITQLFLKFKGKSSLLLIGIYYISLIYLL